MQNIHHILIMAVVAIAPPAIAGDTSSNTSPKGKVVITKGSSSSHRVPGATSINFYYEDGIFSFAPSDAYESLEVVITNSLTGEIWEGMITTDSPNMLGPSELGSYSITCRNEQAQTFIGFFEL